MLVSVLYNLIRHIHYFTGLYKPVKFISESAIWRGSRTEKNAKVQWIIMKVVWKLPKLLGRCKYGRPRYDLWIGFTLQLNFTASFPIRKNTGRVYERLILYFSSIGDEDLFGEYCPI